MEKPKAKLVGQDGNIFNLLGNACVALKRAGQREQAAEMVKRVHTSNNYAEALITIMEFVDAE